MRERNHHPLPGQQQKVNLYPIILGAVLVGGIIITIWGWLVLAKTKKMKSWPTTSGVIEQASEESEANDLLPHIVFSYKVEGINYLRAFKFPEGTHPLPEFNKAYLDRYPVGKVVIVYYDPSRPDNATLEPETRGDWMILALGIMMIIGGAGALLLS
ncbi:DUF3592 domain-containing protein [Kaarinaea lacus]